MAQDNNFIDNVITSFSLRAMAFKFFTGVFIVVAFAFEQLRVNIDKRFVKATGAGEYVIGFILGVWDTYYYALMKALASLYPIIIDIKTQAHQIIPQGAYFSISLAVAIFLIIVFQYQSIVALVTSFFLPEWSNTSTFILSLVLTSILVLIASVVVSVIFGADASLFTTSITEAVNNTVMNTTSINQSEIPIIDMLNY